MSDNLQNLLREALLNNSYDYNSMHNVLRMAWENSYSYLYNLQKNYVEYEDLEYISNDTDKSVKRIGRLYNDKLLRACFDIGYDFIHVCDREEFHNSEFYFNEFTFYDMVFNPTIFQKLPIIIIDGQCIWDYKLRANKKSMTVILPFKRDFVINLKRDPETDELVYIDHNIRVLVIDNIYYSELRINSLNINEYGDPYNSYNYNENFGLGYNFYNDYEAYPKVKHGLSINVSDYLLNRYNIDPKNGLFAISISKNTNNKKNLTEFLSSNIIISEYEEHVNRFIIGEELYQNLLNDDSDYTIHLFFMNKLHNYNIPLYRHDPSDPWYLDINGAGRYDYSYYYDNDYYHYYGYYGYHDSTNTTRDIVCDKNGECNVFMLQHKTKTYYEPISPYDYEKEEMCKVYQPYAMPIPVEDLIVIKFDSDNNPTLMRSTETVKLYYPNIYRIIDSDRKPGDRYQVSYFYHEAYSLEYTPVHEYFFRFLQIHYNERPIEDIIDFIYRGVDTLSSFTEEQAEELLTTFNKILEYQYFNHQYCEVDFLKRYILEPGNNDKEVVEYKDETLKKWINEFDQFLLRDYVLEQDKLYTSVYHLWTNTIDLSNRIRTDTFEESKFEIYAYYDYLDNTYFTETGNWYDSDGHYVTVLSDIELKRKLQRARFKSKRKILVSDNWRELNGEYYVFAFRNEETVRNSLLRASVFVDGFHVDDIIQVRYNFTDYFYIPVELVTWDSYIEIEVFPTYKYGTRVRFDSVDDSKTITLLEPVDHILPTAQDLFYMEPSGHFIHADYNTKELSRDAKGIKDIVMLSSKQGISISTDRIYPDSTIYSNELFDITANYKEGNFDVKTTDPNKPVKFTRLSTFEIRPLHKFVINKDLYVGISKIPNYITYRLEYGGYPYLALCENKFKFNLEYLRIFINGRLLPRQRYCFYSSFIYPRIQFLDHMEAGDVIHIEVTPYRYKEIYYQKDLKPGETLINLKNIITKPFDIRYYDVYMNGRKLGLNSVWTISPWEITLSNIKSLHNLQIFEKERDWEYFGTNYNENNYFYTIDDLFNSSFIDEEEKNQIIREIMIDNKEPECIIRPPEDEEEPIDFSDEDKIYSHVNEFYFNELIPKTFVNPDTKQFDDDIMKEEYTTVDDAYRVHTVDSYRSEYEKERRAKYVDALSLNPDVYIEGENGDIAGYVYCVGHPENVEDILLADTPDNYYKEEGIVDAD